MPEIEVGLKKRAKNGAIVGEDGALAGGDNGHGSGTRRPRERIARCAGLRDAHKIHECREITVGLDVRNRDGVVHLAGRE